MVTSAPHVPMAYVVYLDRCRRLCLVANVLCNETIRLTASAVVRAVAVRADWSSGFVPVVTAHWILCAFVECCGECCARTYGRAFARDNNLAVEMELRGCLAVLAGALLVYIFGGDSELVDAWAAAECRDDGCPVVRCALRC